MIVAIAALASATAAHAASASRCQQTIESQGGALLSTTMRHERACARQLARGRLPANTRCWGIGDDIAAIGDARTRDAIERAVARASAAIEAACGGVDYFAVPPDGPGFSSRCPALDAACDQTLFDAASVVRCVTCNHVAAAQHLVAVQHPGSTLTTTNVNLHFTTSTPLNAFHVKVHYPVGKGSFVGTGDAVQCVTSPAQPAFSIRNDQDALGNLILIEFADQVSAENLTFPLDIDCAFAVLGPQTLLANDLTVQVVDVTVNGSIGDPAVLSVAVAVD